MKKGSLLLVDDETSFMETMTRRLERRNYRVATATSGEGALSWLARNHQAVDVVVLDVRMPGMSGNEAIARGGWRPEGWPGTHLTFPKRCWWWRRGNPAWRRPCGAVR